MSSLKKFYFIVILMGSGVSLYYVNLHKGIFPASAEGESPIRPNGKGDPNRSRSLHSEPGNAAIPNVRVTDDPTRHKDESSIVSNSRGAILIGWQDSPYGATQCCYALSQDGGETWPREWCLERQQNTRHAGDATVSTDHDGNLYAVCHDYSVDEIRVSYSTDDGDTFSEWKTVATNIIDKPWMGGYKNGTVFISWLGRPGGWKRSTDYGETWESTHSLGNINHGTTFGIGEKGHVHVLYNQSDQRLMYVRSLDSGETAESARTLVSEWGITGYSSRANPRQHPITGGGSDITGQYVVATWSADRTGNWNRDVVWAVISRDYGETWTDPIRVDNHDQGRQIQPWATADRYGRIHVVWTDFRHGNRMNAIYYATTFTDEFDESTELTETRFEITDFFGDYKGITVQGDDVLFNWNSDGEMYFARGVGFARDPNAAGIKHTSAIHPNSGKGKGVYNLKGQRKQEPLKNNVNISSGAPEVIR